MPILPIDLQTLFGQMNQVGKEQAAMKDGAELQASMQNMQAAKQVEEKDNSVNQSEDLGEGIEKAKNDNQQGQEKKQKKDKRDGDATDKKQEFFTDPSLGRHIDIES